MPLACSDKNMHCLLEWESAWTSGQLVVSSNKHIDIHVFRILGEMEKNFFFYGKIYVFPKGGNMPSPPKCVPKSVGLLTFSMSALAEIIGLLAPKDRYTGCFSDTQRQRLMF